MQIELTKEEAEKFVALLRDQLLQLRREIVRTEDRELRHTLIVREEMLEGILGRIEFQLVES